MTGTGPTTSFLGAEVGDQGRHCFSKVKGKVKHPGPVGQIRGQV
jgi:hypothetical protein